MSSVLFSLEGDALIVANKGTEFNRKGVVSICSMDLSAKSSGYTPDDSVYKKEDESFVSSILNKRIETYQGDINILIGDVNREKGIIKSYAGRFVWELLQNADDAANTGEENANLIGIKGIGFKSVLEIANEPEIYSGEFNFHFSLQQSRKILKEEIKGWKEEMIPVCRLPHDKKPDADIKKWLGEGYATVLRLPLREDKKELVEGELSEFCEHSLLFCQALEYVEIRTNSDTKSIIVRRLENDSDIQLIKNGDSTHWRVWCKTKRVGGEKRISVSVCLPVVNNEIRCHEEVSPLHVFFPTAESIPGARALIHASCEVTDDRKHLLDEIEQPYREEICEMLGGITKEILTEIPAGVALRAFGRTEEAANGGMSTQLGNTIAETVRETAFIPLIGGDLAKPGDVRLWKYGLGNAVDPGKVKNEGLCRLDINNDEESAGILRVLGANDAPDLEHARLLYFCRNGNGDECLAAWSVAQSLMAEVGDGDVAECAVALRKAPFWLVGSGQVKARAIDGDVPLVGRKPQDLPSWLSVEIVNKGFGEIIQKEIMRRKKEEPNWENALPDSLRPPERTQDYFNHILLPYCKKLTDDEWQQSGWDVLGMAFKWGTKDGKDEPLIIGSGDSKEERAKIFRLPVGKSARKWAPALQCYGGVAWGGPRIFDKYFANIDDRYVLSPADDWGVGIIDADKEQWKKLLSWLGCSWILKMEWGSQRHPAHHNDSPYTEWYDEFRFEHFDEMFSGAFRGKPADYAPLFNIVPVMYEIALTKKGYYLRYTNKHCESYALQQLKENEWILCMRSLLYPDKRLFKPKDVYFPGSSLGGLLPEVRKHNLDNSAWSEIDTTLRKLGAKDSVSNEAEQLVDYMNQLGKFATKSKGGFKWGKGKGKISRAATEIFSAYTKIDSPPSLGGDVMVPCLRHTHKGEIIYFEEADKVCWANKPYFGEIKIRKEILKKEELHVFFRFLKGGQIFGLKELSKFLEMRPIYGNPDPETTKRLREVYEERRFGMAKAINQKLLEEAKNLEMVAYENIALEATAHATIEIPEIKFWKQGECKVAINAGADMWQGLAAAFGEVMNSNQYKPDFELLLKEESWSAFMRRLRDDYHLTEEAVQEVAEAAPLDTGYTDDVENDGRVVPESGSDEPTSTSQLSAGTASRVATSTTAHSGNNAGGNSRPSEHRLQVPEIEIVSNYPWGPERSASGGRGERNDVDYGEREARNTDGERGEQALLKWLKDEYGDENVTNMNDKHPNHPGYDILVMKDGEGHYYECKSFVSATPPRRVTITKTQFDKAICAEDRYWLCVIYDINAECAKMLDPITNLATLEKESIGYKINLASQVYDTNE